MSTKPTTEAKWADLDVVDAVSGQNNVVEPAAAWKDYGWTRDEKPPRNYDNWFKRMVYRWITYLNLTAQRASTYVVAAVDATVDSKNMADAVCDGTGDQIQIQAAIDAVHAAGGGTVQLTEGNFSLLAPVAMDDDVSLVGRGRGATRLYWPDGFAISADGLIVSTAADRIRIAHLMVDGNRAGVGAMESNGIFIGGGFGVLVEDVEAIAQNTLGGDAGRGFYVEGGSPIFRDCYAVDCEEAGFMALAGAPRVKLIACHSQSCGIYGFAIHSASGMLIACTSLTDDVGFNTGGSQVSFVACDVDAAVQEGVELAGAYARWQGGSVRGCGKDGISVTGDGVHVVDAFVFGCGQTTDDTYDGIAVSAGTNAVITGNRIRHGGGAAQHKYGIDLTGPPTTPLVQGNDVVSGGKTAGIYNPSGTTGRTCPEWMGPDAASNRQQNNLTLANRS
jgi:hypothetical protein